jgi:hypothetical protein
MPLGNGDLGLNVWSEPNGDVVFYVSKTDAWSEANNTELVKLGRVRITMTPNPFAGAHDFEQRLDPVNASVVIRGNGARLRLWVDANAPVIRAEIETAQPTDAVVTLDPWRTEPKGNVTADQVLPDEPGRITWAHCNATDGVAPQVAPQVAGRTFGGRLQGSGWQRASLRELRSDTARRSHTFSVVAHTEPSGPLTAWQAALDQRSQTEQGVNREAAWEAHCRWWEAFWNRSFLHVSGTPDAERVSQGYALQRFITACAGRGAYPIKFNGSIFVTDFPGKTRREKGSTVDLPAPMNADERDWGGRYWFQNTRPMYWPRLAAGDFDLMLPLFRCYAAMLPLNRTRVREFYGHDGAYFRETAPFWGDLVKLTPESPGHYTAHYYLPILELSTMMLDYYDYTGDDTFVRELLLPVVTAGLTFYDQHFARDPQGKLLLEPVNAIEMFWKVRNPTPDIAALHFLLPRLLQLPEGLVDAATRSQWSRLLSELPPLSIGEKNSVRTLLPYEGAQTAPPHNSEVPELYAVYPFRLYGVGRPELQLARDTFTQRTFKRAKCWYQDAVWAATLGLTTSAQKDVVATLTNRDPRLRFPAFWDKGHDFAPDQDNGGNGELALQRMLLQADERHLYLLPAWPREWNASFRLHAPRQTVVEGRVEAGKVVELKVTPASRRADVVVCDPAE